MRKLIAKLRAEFPNLRYTTGEHFWWSPQTKEIFYKADARGQEAEWSLLHETGHALLEHASYQGDFELLRLEAEAWQKARHLAKQFDMTIDKDHIEDCLDTYRDWLYKRSICPNCSTKCLQQGDFVHYRCFNCHKIWRVSASRFTRSYRSSKHIPQSAVLFY